MLVNGRRCTVVGRVFLNVATMYVTDLPGKVWRRGEELIFEEIVPIDQAEEQFVSGTNSTA